jgi:hypothetical protein
VVFDSFPSGADVLEGDKRIGATPMQTSLRNAGLEASPRKFRIVRTGFLPYEVMQGPSREPVRVLATLAADPAAAAQAAEAQRAAEEQRAAEQKAAAERKRKPKNDEEPELRIRR